MNRDGCFVAKGREEEKRKAASDFFSRERWQIYIYIKTITTANLKNRESFSTMVLREAA